MANYAGNTITEYSSNGAYLRVFASAGLNEPVGLAVQRVVPEPSSIALLGGGAIVLLVYGWRRNSGQMT